MLLPSNCIRIFLSVLLFVNDFCIFLLQLLLVSPFFHISFFIFPTFVSLSAFLLDRYFYPYKSFTLTVNVWLCNSIFLFLTLLSSYYLFSQSTTKSCFLRSFIFLISFSFIMFLFWLKICESVSIHFLFLYAYH